MNSTTAQDSAYLAHQQHQQQQQQQQQHALPPVYATAPLPHLPQSYDAAAAFNVESPQQQQQQQQLYNTMHLPAASHAFLEPKCDNPNTAAVAPYFHQMQPAEPPIANSSKKRSLADARIEDEPNLKKALNNVQSADEVTIKNLRKNIREVMDGTQLDTNTLAAQREESERLARVSEQQKLLKEYKRQITVNKQYVRTQNRVLSLLQKDNTYAKLAEIQDDSDIQKLTTQFSRQKTAAPEQHAFKMEQLLEDSNSRHSLQAATTTMATAESNTQATMPVKQQLSDDDEISDEQTEITKPNALKQATHNSLNSNNNSSSKPLLTKEIVTIEDSSSDDDCILLSDEDDDEELEEETEEDTYNSGLHVKDTYNVPDEQGRVIVNIGHPEGEEDIYVAPQIAKHIKPHQIGGVRFLFDNIIESTKRFKTSGGFGCILAHSMGLGKTLQVVCFCDIFLRHTNSRSVLCVMPINTLQNWINEFNMWLPKSTQHADVRTRQFDIFVLNEQHKTLRARAKVVLKWAEEGGVLLMGYELFRLLALKLCSTRKSRSKKALAAGLENVTSDSNKFLMDSIHKALIQPGPDLVICDEGHRIKNAHAGISLALKQVQTRRRIVLTGYPLQNNLLEYWCMVDFVRPNYLGNRTEFCNMFERPIHNGQCADSTPEDFKLMRYRSHVLHSLLLGFVQRRSHMVLQQTLPEKHEYVILTRLTSFQRQLYDTFMNDVVRSKSVPNPLKAFAVCCKIWNHPDVLYNFLKKRETDLDLDLEDNELNAATTSTTTTTNNNNSSSSSTTTIGTTQLLQASKEQPSAANADMTVSSTEALTPLLPVDNSTEQLKVETAPDSCSKSFDSMDTSSSAMANNSRELNSSSSSFDSLQHMNNSLSYLTDYGANSYWQEPYYPYFGGCEAQFGGKYENKLDATQQQHIKPVLMDEATSKAEFKNLNATNQSYSNLVDLDTKEIKTVETVMDHMQNANIKVEKLKEQQQQTADNEESNSCMPPKLEEALDAKIAEVKNEICALALSNGNGSSEKECKETAKARGEDSIPYEWAIELMKKYTAGVIENSAKMAVFFCILNESIKQGDRVLLFSQSLLTLNLIEEFLVANYVPMLEQRWARNVSYFRLDGSTSSQEREKLVNEFNANQNVKLFLISTRAGSLGINLVGANRVVVFDASWNPCHDTQAVYRVYRYGQQKTCFIYRIVMDKCLEKKIYDRQIKKQGMSDRIVDESNPDAHLSMKDVTNLCYDYDDNDKTETEAPTFTQPLDSYVDNIIQEVIKQHKDMLSKEPFSHESLLVDRKEKKLSQAEKKMAHRGYELEKKAASKQTSLYSVNKIQYRVVGNERSMMVTKPIASIRPMPQKTKMQTKSTISRTTRWIPAEVWQRQGMTAQEMTLPLDVVIPTNSAEKSDIIIKAGQRVMVLKSAKGIYMQLDSGKIIAIRTSNKAAAANSGDAGKGDANKNDAIKNDGSKMKKDEVIDITTDEGDSESAAEDGKDAKKAQKHMKMSGKEAMEETSCNAKKSQAAENPKKLATETKITNMNSSNNAAAAAVGAVDKNKQTEISQIQQQQQQHQHTQNLAHQQHLNSTKTTHNSHAAHNPHTLPLQQFNKHANHANAATTNSSSNNNHTNNGKTAHNTTNHLTAATSLSHNQPTQNNSNNQQTTHYQNTQTNSSGSNSSSNQQSSTTTTTHHTNTNTQHHHSQAQQQLPTSTPTQATHQPATEPVQMPQYSLNQPPTTHLQAYAKPPAPPPPLHMYMSTPPHYGMQHHHHHNPLHNARASSAAAAASMEHHLHANRSLYGYQQYYDNMYDTNSMPSAACHYPAQFPDYSAAAAAAAAYGSYNNPFVRSSNAYDNAAASNAARMNTDNFQMHWPSYMAPPPAAPPPTASTAPIASSEQSNMLYSSPYVANDAAAASSSSTNQWQH